MKRTTRGVRRTAPCGARRTARSLLNPEGFWWALWAPQGHIEQATRGAQRSVWRGARRTARSLLYPESF